MQYLSILLVILLGGFSLSTGVSYQKQINSLKKEIVSQNVEIDKLSFEAEPSKVGSLAFPPSTVEGTSTAGWTDDGSNVRLNTSSDFVGIGTSNPSEKLSVTGNTHVTGTGFFGGDATIQGGDINLGNGSATSTVTVSSNGNLGIGTTSPATTFAVNGNTFISSTTTTQFLDVKATTTLNGKLVNFPSTYGSNGNVIATDGAGNLSFVAQNADWGQLGESILSSSNATVTVTIAARKDLLVIFNSPGFSQADYPAITFNTDYGGLGTNYVSNTYKNYTSLTASASSSKIRLLNAVTATTSPFHFEMKIVNETSLPKMVDYQINTGWIGVQDKLEGNGLWDNSVAQITIVNVTLGQNPGATFNTGTRLTVYGKKD